MRELLADDEVARVAATILGRPHTGAWRVDPVDYESGSPATGGLALVRGEQWSTFVKLIQHLRHWKLLPLLPAEIRDHFRDDFPWRQELAAWDSTFADHLPAGMRVPELYRLTDLGDGRTLIWMEHIDAFADSAWTLDTFVRAARALGGLAALRCSPEVLSATDEPKNYGLKMFVQGRLVHSALPTLADDEVWRHPLVADAVDDRLRVDLMRLAGALPTILERFDAMPLAVPHGDASPQNLLVAKDRPDEFVAIDIAFQSPFAIGFDLGQLLVGLAHAGCLPAEALPDVHHALVPAFVAGMKDHGVAADPGGVTYGYLGALVVRSAFTSLPFEMLGAATPEVAELFRHRAALTRYIVDLGLEMLEIG